MNGVLQDLRYGIRGLARSPAFALTAALSLAIGIGGNIAIFSVATALLIRPLPGISQPSRLIDIGRTTKGQGFDTTSYPNYKDVRGRATTLSGVYAWRIEPEPMSLAGSGGAERVYGTRVTGNYFGLIGVRPQRGRLFTDADDRPGTDEVVVISDGLWRRRFGADEKIVGTTITITGRPFVVVGITPRGFQGTTILESDLWLPLSTQAAIGHGSEMFTDRRSTWLVMGGRLKPGVTLAQANAELASIGNELAREFPRENADRGLRAATASIFPGRIQIIGGFIALLMAIVGLVLVIACVNLAGMLLARAAARRREIAVRMAIGAGRGRLVRQLLVETSVLFAAGCVTGLLVGRWFIALLLSLLPALPVPLGMHVAIDWRVVAFGIALSLGAAILSGLAPGLQVSSMSLVPSLKIDAIDGSAAKLRLRNAFLVAQIALSLVLVIGGALLVRSLDRAGRIDPGFDQTNVDTVSLNLSLANLDEARGLAFLQALESRVRALPGVTAVTTAADLPLDGDRIGFGNVHLPGAPPEARDTVPIDWNVVTPGFFSTLRVRLVEGRDFSQTDRAGSPPVVIVNHALGRQFWGDADPLGRQVQIDTGFGEASHLATVVGVADDAEFVELGERTPYIYAPIMQAYHPRVALLVRTTGVSAIPAVRALVRQLNPNLPVVEAMPLSDITAIGLVPQRLAAAIAGTLGLVGLLLAAMGIYGVTSYSVGRRTREIGIRMALGADRRSVMAIVLRQAAMLALTGIGLGLLLGIAASQALRSLLFGVSAIDPSAFGGAAVLFVLISLAASYLPARRAAGVDPMIALRAE
jgi:predicted permease